MTAIAPIFHSQPWVQDTDVRMVEKVLHSAMLVKGSIAQKLELEMATYLNKRYALFTGNGSQAQALILEALGVGKGDEVILPSYVCNKVYFAVQSIGAIPVLCDIGPDWVMTPEHTEVKITKATKAIVLPHIFGLNAWQSGFEKFNIPVIEDVCQSLGHLSVAHRSGTYTDYAFTSFHGTKCIGAGEGGMLFVNDEQLYRKIVEIKSRNSLFTAGTDVVAALILSQFQRYTEILKRRAEIAKFYNKNIGAKWNAHIAAQGVKSMHFRYILESDANFETVKAIFLEQGIHVRKGVDSLLHREFGKNDQDFPNSTHCFERAISIPILPQLTDGQLTRICDAANTILEELK